MENSDSSSSNVSTPTLTPPFYCRLNSEVVEKPTSSEGKENGLDLVVVPEPEAVLHTISLSMSGPSSPANSSKSDSDGKYSHTFMVALSKLASYQHHVEYLYPPLLLLLLQA